MKVIKYLGILVVAALLLYVFVIVFVITFSSVESRFQCSGEISSNGGSQPTTIYFKLEKYRWWVRSWNDSNGLLWLEIPKDHFGAYYGRVVEIGNDLHIYDYPKNYVGYFSTLSKTLTIKTPLGFFDGTCKRNDQ